MPLVNNKILNRFFSDCKISDVSIYGNGHINNTFRVITNRSKFILQQVNSKVFNIDNLVHNYSYFIEAALKQKVSGKLFPDFVTDSSGLFHFVDTDGTAWRLNKFIENSSAYAIPPDTSITEKAGKAMGKFQLFLSTLDAKIIKDTIPKFHDPQRRLVDFQNAVKIAHKDLKKSAETEINFALENTDIAKNMSDILSNKLLPVRITHNDTKLDNILFDNTNNHAYVIDLDTVMKGSVMFDFGDMVRTITSMAKEDEEDISKITFRLDHFEAICKGYVSELRPIITPFEKEHLLSGALSIIYVQCLRFLGDYIAGDPYYKTNYPTHNLVRTRTQIKLLQEILNNKKAANDIIKSVL